MQRPSLSIAGTLWVVAFAFIVYKSGAGLPVPAAAGPRGLGDFILAVLADFCDVGIAIGNLSMVLAPLINATGVVVSRCIKRW